MDSELESFRDQWLRELGSEAVRDRGAGEEEDERDPMAVAVELFLKAGRNEEKGKMVKAVRLYRRAFKLCPELEEVQTQRELRLAERVEEESRAREEEKTVTSSPLRRSTPSHTHSQSHAHTHSNSEFIITTESERECERNSLPHWALEFSSSPSLPVYSVAEGKAHISVLPNELLVNVLRFCADTPETLEAAGRVCRRWFATSRESSLWRAACVKRWPGEEEQLATFVREELEGNWRRCFLDRPRPRCDGLYVSTNKYVRQGEQEGYFYDPIHEVHYWRILRFYGTGEVLSLCTVEKSSVKRMHIQVALQQREQCRRSRGNRREPGQHLEKTDLGSFHMVGDSFATKVQIVTQAASGKHINTMTGSIFSSRSGWQDRIKLESYVRTKTESNTISQFDPEFIALFKFVKLPPQFLEFQRPE